MRKILTVIGTLLAGILSGCLSGCTTYVPHSISMGGVVMPSVDIVGAVDGEARKRSMLIGPFPIEYGDASLKAAVADALSKRGGDSLVNVTVDTNVTIYPFPFLYIKDQKTIVSGTAIRFKK